MLVLLAPARGACFAVATPFDEVPPPAKVLVADVLAPAEFFPPFPSVVSGAWPTGPWVAGFDEKTMV
ncbi:MAG: hypothetical protein WBM06_16405 [Pseudolabrys sp.]